MAASLRDPIKLAPLPAGSYHCTCTHFLNRQAQFDAWRIVHFKCNHSVFNGGRRTHSDYSQIHCTVCRRRWRTKAGYVMYLRHL